MISWRPMRSRPRLALVLAMLAAAPAACGPIAYVGEVTWRADSAVAEARHAEAEKHAPYWWTRATQYLKKAREVAARADFQGANRYGRLATEAARQAVIEAQDPAKRPIDPQRAEPPQGPAAAPAQEPAGMAPGKGGP